MKLTAPGEVGENLRALRKGAGVTADELAIRADVHHTTVTKVELGYNEPDLDTSIKLAHSLGLSLGDLVRGPEAKSEKPGRLE